MLIVLLFTIIYKLFGIILFRLIHILIYFVEYCRHDYGHTYETNFDSISLLLIDNPIEFLGLMSAQISIDKPQLPLIYKEFPLYLYYTVRAFLRSENI